MIIALLLLVTVEYCVTKYYHNYIYLFTFSYYHFFTAMPTSSICTTSVAVLIVQVIIPELHLQHFYTSKATTYSISTRAHATATDTRELRV